MVPAHWKSSPSDQTKIYLLDVFGQFWKPSTFRIFVMFERPSAVFGDSFGIIRVINITIIPL